MKVKLKQKHRQLKVKQKYRKKGIYLQKKKQQITDEFRLYNNIIMKYQKITNLLENALSQPSKFRTKTWVDITYNTNSQIKFKTAMLKSNLCEYSDACILVKGTITVPNTESTPAVTNNDDKKDIYKLFSFY